MRIVAAASAGYAAAGYFTIIDGIVIPAWFLAPLRDAGYSVAYVVLRAPLAICAERVQNREGESLSDAKVIEQLWRSFVDLGSLERNVLDVGDRDPEEAADLLSLRLADGMLTV
jgi:predicted kinase